ncbi:unnamed protein product [Rotaria sp. Silwood2]|nr:unnamed protein product [Rotaria sp. Silwood2]
MDMVPANDRADWRIIEDKLYQAQLEFEPNTKSSNFTNGDETNDRDENNHIYSSDEDNNVFERFDNIRGFCDQFAWNVFNNDSHIFTFTTYKIWDKLICSLSDIDLNSTYEHVCQYVLDFCFGNVMCGKHGQCVNSLESFKCSCSFFFDGVLCEKFSHQILQMIIAMIIIAVLGSFLLIGKVCTVRRSINQWIIQ